MVLMMKVSRNYKIYLCRLYFNTSFGAIDLGRQYDKNGDLLNWWGNSTEIHFLERAQCIIDQYGNFTEPNTNLLVSKFEYSCQIGQYYAEYLFRTFLFLLRSMELIHKVRQNCIILQIRNTY